MLFASADAALPPREWSLDHFDFQLPAELIAQHPPAERSASRLLDGSGAAPADRGFRQLPELLNPDDLLVFNDTQVIKARLYGRKSSGGRLELLVERVLDSVQGTVAAHMKVSKKPAAGSVLQGFDEQRNKGVDIGGKAGDAVLAAADGRVVYAGSGLRGYGNLIILKHNNIFLTAYAHNQTLLVKEDQNVKRGQKIAEMGNTDTDHVKLHFEIRRQGKPVDPAKFLPAR